MYDINFLVYAWDNKNATLYQSFMIPYAFFALHTHPNCHVELLVDNCCNFEKTYHDDIEKLREYNDNFLIREPTFRRNRHPPHTMRFFEKPTVPSTYTYITDVDIMFLDDVLLSKYKENWPQGLPYNNMLRTEGSVRLTGVHMVKTEEYFTPALVESQKKHYALDHAENDEVTLGQMCAEVFGLPPFSHRFRPIYGIHFSPCRRNKANWQNFGLRTPRAYYDKFMEIAQHHKVLFKLGSFQELGRQLFLEFEVVEPDGTRSDPPHEPFV